MVVVKYWNRLPQEAADPLVFGVVEGSAGYCPEQHDLNGHTLRKGLE